MPAPKETVSGAAVDSSRDTVAGRNQFVIAGAERVNEPGILRTEAALLVVVNRLNCCGSAGGDIEPRGKSKGISEIDDSGIQKLGRAVELHAAADFPRSRDRRNARDRRMLARTIQKRETALFQMPDEHVIGRPD